MGKQVERRHRIQLGRKERAIKKASKLGDRRSPSKTPQTRPGFPSACPVFYFSLLPFAGAPGRPALTGGSVVLPDITPFPGKALTHPVREEGAWLSRLLNPGQPRGPQPHPGLSHRGMKCFID